MTDDERPATADRAWLADWRRRIAELYADVRTLAADDPPTAWEAWRRERETLYRTHPQSPVPAAERDAFRALHWPYDDRMRWTVAVQPAPAPTTAAAPGAPFGGLAIAPVELPNSGAESPALDRIGVVRL